MMQPSFCGTKPFLTGKREVKRGLKTLAIQIQSWFGISSTVEERRAVHKRTYFSILSLLSLGLFLCQLLLSLLGLGYLLSSHFVFLLS